MHLNPNVVSLWAGGSALVPRAPSSEEVGRFPPCISSSALHAVPSTAFLRPIHALEMREAVGHPEKPRIQKMGNSRPVSQIWVLVHSVRPLSSFPRPPLMYLFIHLYIDLGTVNARCTRGSEGNNEGLDFTPDLPFQRN